jgi:hypothetical protein
MTQALSIRNTTRETSAYATALREVATLLKRDDVSKCPQLQYRSKAVPLEDANEMARVLAEFQGQGSHIMMQNRRWLLRIPNTNLLGSKAFPARYTPRWEWKW